MFNVFKKILSQQPLTQQDADKVPEFLLCRWLSGDTRLIDLANTINCLPTKMSTLQIITAISKALKGQIKFIKYPSSPKSEKDDQRSIEYIAKFFKVSVTEAGEYLEWMKAHCPEEIETLGKICKEIKE